MAGKESTTPQQLIEEIRPLLPADAQVKTGVQEAKEDKDDLSEFTKFIATSSSPSRGSRSSSGRS